VLSVFFTLMAATLSTPNGQKIELQVVRTLEDQTKGLSGVKSIDSKEGLLFFYEDDGIKTFWMYNTFFNMDIFFLDKDFRITKISRNMKKSPSLAKKGVAATSAVYCRHVLEMDSASDIAASLKVGDRLHWSN
jgi:uncharacterized membrane protein (UPF0127 family)